MEMMLLKWISKLEYYKLPQHCGLRDRRQFVCFLFTTFAEMLFIPANLMGLNDYLQPHAFDVLNWGQLVFVILLQVAYWRNWLSVRTGLYVFFVEIAAKISTESLCQVFMGGQIHVLGNFNIILILAVVALAVRIKRLAIILVLLLTFDLIICLWQYELGYMVRVMRIFFVGYLLIFFVVFYNSKIVAKGLRQPRLLKEEEKKALEMLTNLTEKDKEKVGSLLDRLSPDSKEQLRKNVVHHFHDSEFESLVYMRLSPELSKSEIEICKLVLQGKVIKEICQIMDKTESNITSQRSHIRSKLKMEKHEELRSGLEIRVLKVRKMLEKEGIKR